MRDLTEGTRRLVAHRSASRKQVECPLSRLHWDAWFQSFQNWQSEFLSVATLAVLTIWLRQQGSPESKPLAAPHHQTGEEVG